jgi:hypothetical protein
MSMFLQTALVAEGLALKLHWTENVKYFPKDPELMGKLTESKMEGQQIFPIKALRNE